ncbi:MAG TPA: hypothetical protein VHG08_26850 [Longimicrobium sp.]|nr:hypothetical protein [Longimicrobium sp.]
MRKRTTALGLALAAAACGGGSDGATVEGTFAPGLSPTGVWVVESERSERADSTGFRLADVTPGPLSLRLLDGADTAGVLNLSGLEPGARVRLRELRVDPQSGFAFPRVVELEGAPVVMVNGLRMAPASRVPREVDVRGAVLGWSSDVGAMLVRPDDARLPDLRVFVGVATDVVGEDGGGADPIAIQPGDSVRVQGRSDQGYVVASRITVPTRIAASAGDGVDDGDPDAASGDGGDGGDGGGGGGAQDASDDGAGAVSRIPRGGSLTPPPPPPPGDVRGRGRDREERGKGRGEEKGKGKGKGRG